MLVAVDSYPVDESPYGVCGAGGNMRDWCGDEWCEAGPPPELQRVGAPSKGAENANRPSRGGGWIDFGGYCRSASRTWLSPSVRIGSLGFRHCRSM